MILLGRLILLDKLNINHLIIFSNKEGTEAEELVRFGLREGSNRVHPGQGTRNRKFYFDGFFLEIAWVHREREIRSELTAPTKLWERANHQIHGCSPFGLCLDHSEVTDLLFRESLKYVPRYLSAGLSFDIITNEEHPYLPWTCRLPMGNTISSDEPKKHQVGLQKLTKVTFGIPLADYQNEFTELLAGAAKISFEYAENHRLTLEFDNNRKRTIKKFDDLPLVIGY